MIGSRRRRSRRWCHPYRLASALFSSTAILTPAFANSVFNTGRGLIEIGLIKALDAVGRGPARRW